MKVKLDATTEKQLIDKASEWLQKGFTNKFACDQLRNICEGLTVAEAHQIIKKSRNHISNEYLHIARDIVSVHTARYDAEITRLLSIEELPESRINNGEEDSITHEAWLQSRNIKIQAYHDALQCMKQKEQLLQLHEDTFVLNVEEQIDLTFKVREEKPNYDMSKLTTEELIEFYELIKLCRQNADVQEIKYNDHSQEVETVDAEIIDEGDPNVSIIRHQSISNEHKQEGSDSDHTAKLKEVLKRQAALAFRDAGASLSDEEKLFLN